MTGDVTDSVRNIKGIWNRGHNARYYSIANHVGRLRFAIEHVNWNINDWAYILFRNISRDFYFLDPCVTQECNVRAASNFGAGSIMIWGGMCFERHREQRVFRRGSLTPKRYIRKVLEENIVSFVPINGYNFAPMQNKGQALLK